MDRPSRVVLPSSLRVTRGHDHASPAYVCYRNLRPFEPYISRPGPKGHARVGDVPRVRPPMLEVPPAQPVVAYVAVVDQHLLGVCHDFDVVVHRVPEPQVGLHRGREDEVLRRAVRADPCRDHGEHRVAAVGPALAEFDAVGPKAPVHRGDELSLDPFVGKYAGAGEPFEEERKPVVRGLERPEPLEQLLRGPVAGVAVDVLVDFALEPPEVGVLPTQSLLRSASNLSPRMNRSSMPTAREMSCRAFFGNTGCCSCDQRKS